MSLFSGLGSALFGVPPVSSAPYTQSQQDAQAAARAYAGREQGAYAGQQQLADNLWNTIYGRGPSVADTQLTQGLDQALAAGNAMGAGASGQNAVLARFLAAGATGNQAARAAQAATLLRAQETANAQGQLGNLTGAMAGESGNLYGTNLANGLGYANLANSANQAQAARDQQAEAAGLQFLSGIGTTAVTGIPKIGGSGGGGGSTGGGSWTDPFTQGSYNSQLGSSDPRASNNAWGAYAA